MHSVYFPSYFYAFASTIFLFPIVSIHFLYASTFNLSPYFFFLFFYPFSLFLSPTILMKWLIVDQNRTSQRFNEPHHFSSWFHSSYYYSRWTTKRNERLTRVAHHAYFVFSLWLFCCNGVWENWFFKRFRFLRLSINEKIELWRENGNNDNKNEWSFKKLFHYRNIVFFFLILRKDNNSIE